MKKLVVLFWQFFKRTPLGKLIRFLSPQWLVNLLEHFPLAVLANIVYGFPSRKIKVIGVTGTDGKTTTVNMIYKILKDSGKRVSMVSTINAVIGEEKFDTGFHVTSPHPFVVEELIQRAVKKGSEYMVLEVTSNALDQNRFWGVNFEIGVVTNITHEHLDYHKTFERYRRAKSKLIKGVRWAVLNKEDANFDYLIKKTKGRVVSFGLKEGDLNLKKMDLALKVPGEYNKANALAAASVAEILGIEKKVIKKSLGSFSNLAGRMEEVKNHKGIKIFIDFAHTPNGLENALKALKGMKGKKIISIIGAEGYRDISKRAMLGEVSARMADYTVITSVDPRGMLQKINSQILEGVKRSKGIPGKNVFVIDDREEAIKFAVSLAKKGDILGIFGKGHETSMNLDGKKEISWSERGVVERVLKNNG